MNKEWMKEDCIAFLHVKVDPLPVLHASDAVIHLVHAAFPIRVVVLKKIKLKEFIKI
jgi:hypothetical protein